MNTKKKYIGLQLKREKKELKRRRKVNKKLALYRRANWINTSVFLQKIAKLKVQKNYSQLYHYLLENDFFDLKLEADKIVVPRVFSFREGNAKTIKCLKSLFTSLYSLFEKDTNEIELSFEDCEKVDLGALLVMIVIIKDFLKHQRKFTKIMNQYGRKKVIMAITLNSAIRPDINNLLYSMHFPVKLQNADEILRSGFGVETGIRKIGNYSENSKGRISSKVRKYINSCLKIHGVELKPKGINLFDNLIGEILNNGEDHSKIENWFVYGSLMEKDFNDDGESVGELNLVFLSFGESIYEGFESTKGLNKEMYGEMETLYTLVKQNSKTNGFTKENMITLYGLQEGYSRLKHIRESRGTGTMTFIRAFMDLGSFSHERYKSELFLHSGCTLIICDTEHKPFELDNRYYLSLNSDKNLALPPSDKHLINLDEKFPGTILSVKIYLSQEYFQNNILA